eukprot:NODE_20_length_39102_cov_0.325513.p4 type:complete len:717 gc:universal NODE_20_length_39102_cov_0.325513:22226-24376(+)
MQNQEEPPTYAQVRESIFLEATTLDMVEYSENEDYMHYFFVKDSAYDGLLLKHCILNGVYILQNRKQLMYHANHKPYKVESGVWDPLLIDPHLLKPQFVELNDDEPDKNLKLGFKHFASSQKRPSSDQGSNRRFKSTIEVKNRYNVLLSFFTRSATVVCILFLALGLDISFRGSGLVNAWYMELANIQVYSCFAAHFSLYLMLRWIKELLVLYESHWLLSFFVSFERPCYYLRIDFSYSSFLLYHIDFMIGITTLQKVCQDPPKNSFSLVWSTALAIGILLANSLDWIKKIPLANQLLTFLDTSDVFIAGYGNYRPIYSAVFQNIVDSVNLKEKKSEEVDEYIYRTCKSLRNEMKLTESRPLFVSVPEFYYNYVVNAIAIVPCVSNMDRAVHQVLAHDLLSFTMYNVLSEIEKVKAPADSEPPIPSRIANDFWKYSQCGRPSIQRRVVPTVGLNWINEIASIFMVLVGFVCWIFYSIIVTLTNFFTTEKVSPIEYLNYFSKKIMCIPLLNYGDLTRGLLFAMWQPIDQISEDSLEVVIRIIIQHQYPKFESNIGLRLPKVVLIPGVVCCMVASILEGIWFGIFGMFNGNKHWKRNISWHSLYKSYTGWKPILSRNNRINELLGEGLLVTAIVLTHNENAKFDICQNCIRFNQTALNQNIINWRLELKVDFEIEAQNNIPNNVAGNEENRPLIQNNENIVAVSEDGIELRIISDHLK